MPTLTLYGSTSDGCRSSRQSAGGACHRASSGGEFAEHLSANDPATGKSTYISRDAKGNTYYLMLVGAPALGTKRRELWVRKDNIHAKKIRIT